MNSCSTLNTKGFEHKMNWSYRNYWRYMWSYTVEISESPTAKAVAVEGHVAEGSA
jgi:hypothetical protein